MSLPRYPEYKDSGVEWLSNVPTHWTVMPIRLAARLASGHTPSRSRPEWWEDCSVPWFTLADVSQIRRDGADVIYDTKEKVSEIGLQNSSARQLPAGTVMLSRTASVGFAAIMGVEMATTQDFANWVCGPSLRPRFLLHVFRAMRGEFARLMMGSTHNTIYMPDIAALRFALPPVEEQDAIVSFLDRETEKIDALIAEQEKLIALLAEKRQATISHAVTKGVNPDAPMKDSGVAWLGDVPAHWLMTPLARIAVDRCDGPFGSGIKSEHYTEEGALVVRLQNIRAGSFNKGESVYINEAYFLAELQGHDVIAGDLLVAGLGDENNLLGRACVAPDGLGLALVKADCFRFRLDADKAVSEFVAWQLSAGAAFDGGILATGTTRSRIPLSIMASRKIALPPPEEQLAIARFIASENCKLDALKFEVTRAVGLLKERRSALISAAVTGNVDVRQAVTC